MKIDLEKIGKLVEEGFISVQKHPLEELYIYNYTQRAQFERFWTEETLMCRGLIADGEGNIVARPFPKFFNLEEHGNALPIEPFRVTEKMDGSLGILYWMGDVPFIATRGSFLSDQAWRATQMLRGMALDLGSLDRSVTYLFEIIYPENRIVVDYGGADRLVFLAAIDNETGLDVSRDFPTEHVPVYDGVSDVRLLKGMVRDNAEGFVVRFESGLRVKVKFEEYIRLHRIVTNTTARSIWEVLKDGQSIDSILERVPDEFFRWVRAVRDDLLEKFESILNAAENAIFEHAYRKMSAKAAALHIMENYPQDQHVIFAILKGKDVASVIWKKLKPAAAKPFKVEI